MSEAAKAPEPLQNSGLTDSRLLARLLQAGVIVLDQGLRLVFASPGACAVLGVAGEAELRERWQDIAAQLRLAHPDLRPSRDGWRCGRADVNVGGLVRPVRYEVHAVTDGTDCEQRVLLLRERERLLRTDRAMLLASEAVTNRHALRGLVHSAKGPLNNFSLTLQLLATSIERVGETPASPELRARWQRYIDVMRAETTRLAGGLDEIHALATPPTIAGDALDVCALVRDVVRMLHHEAAMREVDLEADVPDAALAVRGDAHLVRLALLGFAVTLLAVTDADGRVLWRAAAADDPRGGATITITTSLGALPTELIDTLFRLACVAESEHSAAIAARMIIEAHGGDVSIEKAAGRPVGFRLRIPPSG